MREALEHRAGGSGASAVIVALLCCILLLAVLSRFCCCCSSFLLRPQCLRSSRGPMLARQRVLKLHQDSLHTVGREADIKQKVLALQYYRLIKN